MDAQPNTSDHYHPNTLTPAHNHKRWLEVSPETKRKHQIRNEKIVKMYAQEAMSMRAIGLKFGLSSGRIQAIISKNAHLLAWDLNHEKARRVNRLRQIDEAAQAPGLQLAVVRELREEFQGKSGGVNVNVNQNVSINMTMNNMVEKLHASRISPA